MCWNKSDVMTNVKQYLLIIQSTAQLSYSSWVTCSHRMFYQKRHKEFNYCFLANESDFQGFLLQTDILQLETLDKPSSYQNKAIVGLQSCKNRRGCHCVKVTENVWWVEKWFL